MIIDHIQFDLYQKKVFERMVAVPPLKIKEMFDNEACFLYMVSGEQEVNSPVEHRRLNSREAVLMKCGLHFSELLKSEKTEHYEAIAVHLYPEVLKKIYDKEFPEFITSTQANLKKPESNKIVNDELIYNYIASMQFYFNNPSLVSDELLVLKLKELIILLMKTENASSVQYLFSSLFSPREYSFKEIIEAHIISNLSIEELSELTNLSVSSFKREFNRIFKDSPAHYFKNKKLERVAELLLISNQRISDIAYECGFNDQAHFSKSFQKKFGISPSEYRLNRKDKSLS